jgi:hypothetical protein
MKTRKTTVQRLAADALLITAVALANRCLKTKEPPMVKRDSDEKSLSRKLTMVSLVYHVIGIFYNE